MFKCSWETGVLIDFTFFFDFLWCFSGPKCWFVLPSLLDIWRKSVAASEYPKAMSSISSSKLSADIVVEELQSFSTTWIWNELVMQGMSKSFSFSTSGEKTFSAPPCPCVSDPKLISYSVCSSFGISGNGSDISRSTSVFSWGSCSLTFCVAPVHLLISIVEEKRKHQYLLNTNLLLHKSIKSTQSQSLEDTSL